MNSEQIGKNIRAIRTANGLSQKRVGKILGVSAQQFRKYETGENRISAVYLPALAALFGVRISDFFGGDILPSQATGRRYIELISLVNRMPDEQQLALRNLARAMAPPETSDEA